MPELLFFFTRPRGDRLDLHSFPTRRSSDLDGERRHRLAAARFSDQRDGAALGDVEADALDGAQRGRLVDAEVDRQVAHAEQAHFSLGSSASRSASVSRLKALTSTAIAKVAAAICHHLPRISSLCASASMLPQDTVRSEERRVGKECRTRGPREHEQAKTRTENGITWM